MSGGLEQLLAAAAAFVGGHFLLSSAPVRAALVRQLGERLFLTYYAVLAGILFIWLLIAYRAAPFDPLWQGGAALRWLVVIVMPAALFLAVGGLTTPSATMAGADALIAGRDPTQGVMRITRHPFLCGVALWAFVHLLANGDAASVIFFVSLLILSVGGIWHIDRKKERQHGAAWGPLLLTTSAVPFLALIQKRTTFDWAGIGWWRPAATIVLYVVIIWAHPLLIGVSAWPG